MVGALRPPTPPAITTSSRLSLSRSRTRSWIGARATTTTYQTASPAPPFPASIEQGDTARLGIFFHGRQIKGLSPSCGFKSAIMIFAYSYFNYNTWFTLRLQEHELAAAQLAAVSAEIILMLNPYLDFSFLNIRNAEQSMEACLCRFRATLYLWTFFASAALYMNFLIWRAGMEELGMDVEKADMLELTDHIFFSFLPLSFLVVVFYIDPFNGHVSREDMA